jgi:cell division inhibitor SepF
MAKQSIDKAEFITYRSDTNVFKLADMLLKSIPIVVNFEQSKDNASNKVITFLSGVTYAVDGEIEAISQRIYLFATKLDFKDGSLRKFVDDHKEI